MHGDQYMSFDAVANVDDINNVVVMDTKTNDTRINMMIMMIMISIKELIFLLVSMQARLIPSQL